MRFGQVKEPIVTCRWCVLLGEEIGQIGSFDAAVKTSVREGI